MNTEVDARGLPVLPGLTPEQVRAGFSLFFVNKADEALAFFTTHNAHPLCELGRATLMVAQAFVSFEEDDINATVDVLQALMDRIKPLQPDEGALSSLGRWFSGAKKEQRTTQQISYEVMMAECKLLSACLQFLQESMIDKLKGGWAMRAAWQLYAKIAKEQEIVGGKDHLDIETRSGLEFGLGVFNLACSILPPRIMKVAAIFGFPSDRNAALASLRFVSGAGTVHSPVGALTLLSHHVGLQSAFGLGTFPYLADATAIVTRLLEQYPDGALFLLTLGRIKRLERDVEGGIAVYRRAVDLKLTWRQLNDLINYELGWSYLGLFKGEEAKHFFTALQDNRWSQGYYRYMLAMCHFSLEQHDDAMRLLGEVEALCTRKIQGKLVPAEEFVMRKAAHFLEGGDTSLAVYEIMFLWNVFPQLPIPMLTRIAGIVKGWLDAHTGDAAKDTQPHHHAHHHHHKHAKGKGHKKSGAEEEAVARLIRAGALVQAGEMEEAGRELDVVDSLASHCKHDTYVGPFALYERAIILTLRHAPHADRLAALKKCLAAGDDFDFSTRLQFRCNLAMQDVQLEGLV